MAAGKCSKGVSDCVFTLWVVQGTGKCYQQPFLRPIMTVVVAPGAQQI
ncbi:hypothetical protein L195_g029244 [Trifolium pratense]|uniref:Uncharacterized protein n=1 Tax=Trifolium pratense TaxID=57577 RepID=A0A2K3L493_TRIPR|nr:hypothetical protein L195_g029244 [Trifolium pratense]